MSKGIGSTNRCTSHLAQLRHTKVNPAVASDLQRLMTTFSTTCLWFLSKTSALQSESGSYHHTDIFEVLEAFSTGEMATHPSYLGPKNHPGMVYPSNRTAIHLPLNAKSTFDLSLRVSMTFPRYTRKIFRGRPWRSSASLISRTRRESACPPLSERVSRSADCYYLGMSIVTCWYRKPFCAESL